MEVVVQVISYLEPAERLDWRQLSHSVVTYIDNNKPEPIKVTNEGIE